MDEPPHKRRKSNSTEEREQQSSPLRKPPRRPSFASPTKASLARNYPNLLPSTTKSPARGEILARGKQARAFVLGETIVQPETNQITYAPEAERETTAGAQQRRPKDQNVTPRARKLQTSRNAAIYVGASGEEEPELPPTPSQIGFKEQDGPRRGVLFSSPSKRPPRVKDAVKSLLRQKAPPVQSDDITGTVEDGPADQNTLTIAQKRQPPNPEVEDKKREQARLQREVEELEAQVSRCTEEIFREQQRAPDQVLRPTERTDLNNFLASISGTDTEQEKPALISSLLCSFLPFSALSVPQPRSKQPAKPIPSHRPVELADPMPYLEMFTSFKFSTQLGLPRGKVFPASRRVHQKHTIDIVGPQKLLTAQVSIIIDALAIEIIDMHIIRISPWAERELGTYIRGKAKEEDLANACWAIDSYWEIAKKRAQYWQKCEAAFAHLLAGRSSGDTENRPQARQGKKSVSRKDLNRHLGRDTLVLQDKHVLLKLNWRISFDWTGEAESEMNVEPAFPQVWRETDTADSLKKVPETFASLLRAKGAFEATRIMTALLFPQ